MFILSIVPLVAIPRPAEQKLHYFSQKKLRAGQLVEVALRNRKAIGVVVSCRDAKDMRMEIKRSPYPLKAVPAVLTPHPIIQEAQLCFAQWIADYYYASLGIVLRRMLPAVHLRPTKPARKALAELKPPPQVSPGKSLKHGVLIVGENRYSFYKKYLLDNKGHQMLVLAPEYSSIARLKNVLRSVSLSAREFHGTLGTKMKKDTWLGVYQGEISSIIGTRSALLLLFSSSPHHCRGCP